MYSASAIASFSSSFFNKVFKAKSIFTFLSLAYLIASFRASLSKFPADARALKISPPR